LVPDAPTLPGLAPTFVLITTYEVLELEVHVSVTEPPATIPFAGLTDNETVGGGGAAFTVIVADAVTVPPGPVTVYWYVVVDVGDT
jgi:hypothetical protein